MILAQTVTNNGLRLDVMMMQLVLVWVLFLPKTTVTVEHFNNAAPPVVVDDVPYAVAFPAALAGDFSLYMTQKIETVMSSVNGNYLSVTDGISPFTPARILLSFTTCPLDPLRCMDQNMVETMGLAARYCGGGDLSNARFEKSQDVLTDFANTLTKQGSTIIMTPPTLMFLVAGVEGLRLAPRLQVISVLWRKQLSLVLAHQLLTQCRGLHLSPMSRLTNQLQTLPLDRKPTGIRHSNSSTRYRMQTPIWIPWRCPMS